MHGSATHHQSATGRFEADAFTPRLWAPLEWFRHHPRVVDVIAILLSTAPPAIALWLAPPTLAGLGYLLLGATGVVLWWRRVHPWWVLSLVVVFTALSPLTQPGFSPVGFGPAVALYTLAARATVPRALLGYLLAVVIPMAAAAVRLAFGFERVTPTILEPTLLVALLLGVIVRSRAEQRRALAETVNARIEHAAVAERNRITAEMHDAVSHSITVMVALAGGARVGWQKHPERALEALNQLEGVGANVLDEMHSILRVLRSGDAELHASIETSGRNQLSLSELVATFRAAGLPVTLNESGFAQPVEPGVADLAVQNAVYRIVQESLTNALRYAQHTTSVDVVLHHTETEIHVTVADDGLPEAGHQRIGAGLGLTAMAERAAALGGTHVAGRLPGGGWHTDTRIPIRSTSSPTGSTS